jgi:hypothetical protein
MPTSNRSLLQKLAAKTPQGKQLDGIITIAEGPVPAGGIELLRYDRACAIKEEYGNVAARPFGQQFISLWKLFEDTEQFYRDYPNAS